MAGTSHDTVGTSKQGLLFYLRGHNEGIIGIGRAGGDDVDDRTMKGVGGVANHGDARVDGSRLRLGD